MQKSRGGGGGMDPAVSSVLPTLILRTIILRNSFQLASAGCQDSLIKSTQHATLLLTVTLL